MYLTLYLEVTLLVFCLFFDTVFKNKTGVFRLQIYVSLIDL